MNISRQQMDHAVRHIRQGLMQPDEAARWLLAEPSVFHRDDNGSGAATMTVAELQAMLGPAPLEIRRDWDRQLATISASFEACQGRALPDLTTHDLWVDADNRLSLASHILGETACDDVPPDATGQSSEPTDSRHRSEHFRLAQRTTEPSVHTRKPKRYLRPWYIAQRRAIAATILLSAALAMVVAFDGWTSFRWNADTASSATHRRVTTADPPSRDAIKGIAVAAPKAASPSVFSPAALPEPQPRQVPLEPQRSTAIPMSPPAQQAQHEIATLSPVESKASNPALGFASGDDQWLSTNESSPVTGFELPPVPARDVQPLSPPVTVVSESIADLTLSFPIDVGLSLLQTDARWIVQTKEREELAVFSLGNEGLAFQWTARAASHPIAKQLASAALAYTLPDGTQRSIFLRPELSAPACPIDLTSADTTVAWPIEIAPPAASSTLILEFEHPQEVIQTWIRPHDPKQYRKSQSISEFSLSNDPTVAIRSLLDLRTGTRVSLRLRHAARLDAHSSWQWISSHQLSAAHDYVTERLAAALAEQSRLKGIYSHASTADRKTLGMRRETVDLLVSRLQRLNARLDQFQQLFNLLDGNAYLNVCLSVHWPQAAPPLDQTILATAVPAGDVP